MNQEKFALITGAGRRFGFALAERLLAQGYQVFAHYNTSKAGVAELEQHGAIGIQADMSDLSAAATIIDTVKQHTDRLDLLVNNASCFFTNEVVDSSNDNLQAVFGVHAMLPYLLCRDLAPLLRNSDNGLIVNITDIYTDSPSTDYVAYCAAKTALASLTQGFAKTLAPAVRVNAIQPGPVLFLPEHDGAHKQKVLAETPLKLEGGLEPMLKTVEFLRDNPFMTGEFIKVDGGRALLI